MSDYNTELTDVLESSKSLQVVSVTGTLADVPYRISTGCDVLDIQTNGGIPGGRVVEIYGQTSSGKSLLALSIIAECQKQGGIALLLDSEATTGTDFMEMLGVQINRVIVANPETIEDVRKEIEKFIAYKQEVETELKKRKVIEKDQIIPAVVVWDSVAATTADDVVKKVDKEGLDSVTVAKQARQLSALFRDARIHQKLNEAAISAVLINQERHKIGVLWGEKKATYGGEAIPYYSSLRIKLDHRKGLILNGEEVGIQTRAEITKSKVGVPFGKARLAILFNNGIANSLTTFYALEDLELLGKNHSWLVLTVGDEEYKFQRKDMIKTVNEHYQEVLRMIEQKGPNRIGVINSESEEVEEEIDNEDDTSTD